MGKIRKKRVLIHSLVFSPDGVSTAYLYNDIAMGLKAGGFDVVVITTTPHYNYKGKINSRNGFHKKFAGLFFTKNYSGIQVFHIPQKKFNNTVLRMIGFVYWHLLSLMIGLFKTKFDYVLAPSPPLTIGIIIVLLGKLKKAKIIYNVQEIYPDLLINNNNLNSGLLIWILKKIEKFVYKYSDRVVTIDQVFYTTIYNRFQKPDKLKIIPNFVDTGFYKPEKPYAGFISKETLNANTLKIMYAGNIGHAQDWETLIEVAKRVANQPVEFFIIGDGVKKQELLQEISSKKLKNIKVIPYQKRNLMPKINAFADVHIILMEPNVASLGFPSKVYTILACGKPLIISSTKNSPLFNFLKNLNVGFLINCENKNTLIISIMMAILNYINDKELLKHHANNARKVILDHYSKEVVVKQYIQLIKSL